MIDLLFYLFAALTLGSAAAVVLNRSAVNAAMCLLLTFVGMAGLFVLLEAYFLAVLQVLVYAGAVVVLFVFIVMLLDIKTQERKAFTTVSLYAAGLAGLLMVFAVFSLFAKSKLAAPALPATAVGGTLKIFGQQLFTTYLLPMQITGFLLLIAMLGVIVLSKRPREEEAAAVARAKTGGAA